VPVYVGADRYAAGLLAEQTAGATQRLVHVLDDGFQHRRLTRDLDVVLLTEEDAKDCLLPAGNLREPLQRLRDADVVVLRAEEEAALRAVVARWAGAAKAVWMIRRRLVMPEGAPLRPLAFCGIAREESFFSMLRAEGVLAAGTVAFGDHHRYREQDISRLIEDARRVGADGFVTTEKDAVKITEAMQARLLTVGSMTVARLMVAFVDEATVAARLARLERPPAA
jgi:tetraacyldisaccharide 4'-kinase